MSAILAFRINFTIGSISNVHTCVKVYTSCQFGAFFTKCTMLLHIRFTKQLTAVNQQQSISDEIICAEHECMNMCPLPPSIIEFATPLYILTLNHQNVHFSCKISSRRSHSTEFW